MTVKELKEKLEEFPDEYEVEILCDGTYVDIDSLTDYRAGIVTINED